MRQKSTLRASSRWARGYAVVGPSLARVVVRSLMALFLLLNHATLI